ncbi:tRNA threonylcarbamoyladenosine biosynthesis protein TsaE [Raineyella antarctica]|uniref:tRNA threonylcarbamoyladenosine biosynthesis protein TsaE n=1 Tax=Raineyella antarctica TaxID=1577474 RepID=A0A1G6I120_9ACTN|nr:tRNA (adenosine(37)-N6)-threonylcarbamoyltransferase complex ATPase subunit type 1 TsaE [Raineyella antarctica]SDC00151.1 tRNA threonylcarbamoyladenosine biosynthesis protein TsaE [Raineyella antarctica]
MSAEPQLDLALATEVDAPALVEVIRTAFGARRAAGPPPAAMSETEESVARALRDGFGIIARVDGRPAGAVLVGIHVDVDSDSPAAVATWHRVSVHPDFQRHGIATSMIETAEEMAALRGCTYAELGVRMEFPELLAWWTALGYEVLGRGDKLLRVGRELPVAFQVPTGDDMHALGEWIARVVRAGDLIIASGSLGAGKTTFTQGLGAGMGVEGPVVSPTFVLSRVHPAANGGPTLVHVDAYRLGDGAELDDIDLDESAADAVTLVEWGEGLAERLNSDRLMLSIERSGDPDDETRFVFFRGFGERWEHLHRQIEMAAPIGGLPRD